MSFHSLLFPNDTNIGLKNKQMMTVNNLDAFNEKSITLFNSINYDANNSFNDDSNLSSNIIINPSGNKNLVKNFIQIGQDSEENSSKLKVAVASTIVDKKNIINSIKGKATISPERKDQLYYILNLTERENVDLLVLPENSVPLDYLGLIADFSRRHQRAIVFGLEHIIRGDIAYNYIVNILPFKNSGKNDVAIIFRQKNHYAPKEKELIRGYGLKKPPTQPYRYDLIKWRNLYFSNYYCVELTNIKHRGIFKSKVDFLIASEWNPDVNYFSNLVESVTRDVHCYFIQSNTAQFGDSRITCPKKTVEKDVLRLKGGENDTILVGSINIHDLREFQLMRHNLQLKDKNFKPTPPAFSRKNVLKRINNDSF